MTRLLCWLGFHRWGAWHAYCPRGVRSTPFLQPGYMGMFRRGCLRPGCTEAQERNETLAEYRRRCADGRAHARLASTFEGPSHGKTDEERARRTA